jgi:hypothetical protein
MDLRGCSGEFHFTVSCWVNVLKLAMLFGWKPAGTRLYDEDGLPELDWCGSYCSNGYQEVTEDDARRLADALERSLPDIPNEEAMADRLVKVVCDGVEVYGIPDGVRYSPLEFWSGGGKQKVREFVAYCRAGSFVIG